MLSTLLFTLTLTAQAPEPRYWISLTNHPGEQAFGRINAAGYAVDITERRKVVTVAPVVNQAPAESTLFLMALNAWRAQHGRGPLRWDAGLAAHAASNRGVHDPGSMGGARQCWAGTSSLMAALGMWQGSSAHASILLNATSVIGASRCPSGSTANAR